MRFHPDVLRCHEQFGGDLEDMQRRYGAADKPTSTTQPTPTATGVSEAIERLRELHREEHRKLGQLLTDKSPEGNSSSNWQGGKVNGIGEAIAALETALSTAPAGDGVPGMAKSALDCVVHALMVLPVPIDGQGKRAWASLLEAQTILEALSTASTAGKG